APFFVLGLRIPTAVIAAIGTLVVFTATALWKHLPPLIVFRCASFLALALIACFVAAQHFERTSRKAFLEGHLIAELAQHDALTGA
ncbi:hypothetical protein, partial [Klebsiella pneumoniae]|uniref:hypothetical protein n=1 Tax=Klebsiella pneumoniae TaxID=573 RepID=UPI0038532E0F